MTRSRTLQFVALSILIASGFGVTGAVKLPPHVIVLTHATVIDGTGAPPRERTTIVIRRGRVSAVAADDSISIPAAAHVTHLSGKFIIPGLIDSHVHLGTQVRDSGIIERILNHVLTDGVTTVRDMGGNPRIVQPLASSAPHAATASPRIYYSAIMAGPGRWFEGEFGRNAAGGAELGKSPLVQRLDRNSDALSAVTAARNAGATGIKIYDSVGSDQIRALSAEARKAGLKVWSHLSVGPGRPLDVLTAGVDVVSHADQFRAELLTGGARGADSASRALRVEELHRMSAGAAGFRPLLEEMRRRGIFLDPTLSIMLPFQAPADTSRESLDRVYGTFRFSAQVTRRAAELGIPIVAGTDAIGGSTANLHAELQILVDSAGLTPLQAIRAATLNGALALGAADSLGTISVGKLADLVILCANPAAEITNTQSIYAVMKGGVLYRRSGARRPGPFARPPVRGCDGSRP